MIEVRLADGRIIELPDMPAEQVAQTIANLTGTDCQLDASAVRAIRDAAPTTPGSLESSTLQPELARPPLVSQVQPYTPDEGDSRYGQAMIIRAAPEVATGKTGVARSVLARSFGASGTAWVGDDEMIRDRWSGMPR